MAKNGNLLMILAAFGLVVVVAVAGLSLGGGSGSGRASVMDI